MHKIFQIAHITFNMTCHWANFKEHFKTLVVVVYFLLHNTLAAIQKHSHKSRQAVNLLPFDRQYFNPTQFGNHIGKFQLRHNNYRFSDCYWKEIVQVKFGPSTIYYVSKFQHGPKISQNSGDFSQNSDLPTILVQVHLQHK